MPYIDENRQEAIIDDQWKVNCHEITNPGELTYALSFVCDYVLRSSSERFADYAAVIGALECTKQELYRRLVAPYEDTKIEEGTDVFHR